MKTITHTTAVLVATAAILTAVAGAAQASPRTSLKEGTQVVGTDVVAGTYHTAGPRESDYGYCFIEWLPYKGARSSELIDIQSYTGESYVTLRDGDVVTVDGCHWTLDN
ncbi:hypothetical protein ABZV58_14295 [Nocardia sp. NPDC004654]|uniref:hypothetical protein n=1 Tax=Nocardia sp. NPDC004654 TaxID=3154776 RepID=UPI0033BCAE47